MPFARIIRSIHRAVSWEKNTRQMSARIAMSRPRSIPAAPLCARDHLIQWEMYMRFLILVKAKRASKAGAMPSEQLLADMGKFNQELTAAGIMLDGGGLHPSSKGARVTFSGTDRTVTKGPFANTNELVSGYWVWKLSSLEEAINWVKRCPNPILEASDIEIRQLYEME